MMGQELNLGFRFFPFGNIAQDTLEVDFIIQFDQSGTDFCRKFSPVSFQKLGFKQQSSFPLQALPLFYREFFLASWTQITDLKRE